MLNLLLFPLHEKRSVLLRISSENMADPQVVKNLKMFKTFQNFSSKKVLYSDCKPTSSKVIANFAIIKIMALNESISMRSFIVETPSN